MTTKTILNPHCNTPFEVIEGDRMFIQFYYYIDKKRFSKKIAGNLNDSQFFKKDKNGKKTPTNVAARKESSRILLNEISETLKVDYFNPYTKKFETSDKSSLPLLDWVDTYLVHHNKSKVDEKNKSNVVSTFKYFKEYILTKNPALKTIELNVDLIEGFKDFKSDDWKSNETIANNLNRIKTFVNWLIDVKEVLTKNPLKTLKLPKIKPSDKHQIFSDELGKQVLETAKEHSKELYVLLQFIFYGISRPSEILKLQKKDINFITGEVMFSADKIKTDVAKKSLIPQSLIDYISQNINLDSIPDDYYLLGNNGRNGKNGYYILDLFGKNPNTIMRFDNRFIQVRNKLKLSDNYTIYGWKHTAIVRLKESGWVNDDIKNYSGHQSDSMLNKYAREFQPELIPRIDIIDSYQKEKQFTLKITQSELDALKLIDNVIIKELVKRIV